jgi:hypothetical protein
MASAGASFSSPLLAPAPPIDDPKRVKAWPAKLHQNFPQFYYFLLVLGIIPSPKWGSAHAVYNVFISIFAWFGTLMTSSAFAATLRVHHLNYASTVDLLAWSAVYLSAALAHNLTAVFMRAHGEMFVSMLPARAFLRSCSEFSLRSHKLPPLCGTGGA